MQTINVDNISKIKCIANRAVVKHIGDVSISNLEVVLNEANQKKLGVIGKIVILPKLAYTKSELGVSVITEDLEGSLVVYNRMSRLCKIVAENDEFEYYLIRIPDIYAKLDGISVPS